MGKKRFHTEQIIGRGYSMNIASQVEIELVKA